MSSARAAIFVLVASGLTACSPGSRHDVDPGAETRAEVTHAVAVVHPTAGHAARGVVHFFDDGDGLRVDADMVGLPPGAHAYHVHLLGDCSSPDAESAGTHFNFDGPSRHPPHDIDHITGDLGDLEADDEGRARAQVDVDDASLRGPYSILGRSVVVHEKPNDPDSPPIGAAGARIGCGVIGIAE